MTGSSPRRHDLPPRWDGHLVIWEGWRSQPQAFICPPPRQPDCCEGCGSLTRAVMNTGAMAERFDTTLDDVAYDEAARARLPERVRHKYGRKHPVIRRLCAWRCPDCKLDTVHDIETGEWWTLDPSDYTDEGSLDSAPTLF